LRYAGWLKGDALGAASRGLYVLYEQKQQILIKQQQITISLVEGTAVVPDARDSLESGAFVRERSRGRTAGRSPCPELSSGTNV
jgi:hypothetical protein